jgi:hypothetical protein
MINERLLNLINRRQSLARLRVCESVSERVSVCFVPTLPKWTRAKWADIKLCDSSGGADAATVARERPPATRRPPPNTAAPARPTTTTIVVVRRRSRAGPLPRTSAGAPQPADALRATKAPSQQVASVVVARRPYHLKIGSSRPSTRPARAQ